MSFITKKYFCYKKVLSKFRSANLGNSSTKLNNEMLRIKAYQTVEQPLTMIDHPEISITDWKNKQNKPTDPSQAPTAPHRTGF